MSNYFTSDLHFNHSVIVDKYRTRFSSQEEHDNHFLDQFAKLKKRDIVFVLGDFLFDDKSNIIGKYEWYMAQLNKMSCRIKLVMGNHDSRKLYKEDRFEIQLPLFSYKNNWISHCPIHPDELRGRDMNIHGHTHNKLIWREETDLYNDTWDTCIDNRYYSVCPEQHEYEFITFDKILEERNLNV